MLTARSGRHLGTPFATRRLSLAYLAILQPDPRAAARLSEALAPFHDVVDHESWGELYATLDSEAIDGCVIDTVGTTNGDPRDRVRELRRRHPSVTVVVVADGPSASELYGLGALGVHGLVMLDDGARAVKAAVEKAIAEGRGRRVRTLSRRRLPHPGPEALAWAVAHAAETPAPTQMAAALGYTHRELRDALDAAGLPTPSGVLRWGRLLHAAAMITRDGRTVEATSFRLGYSTAGSLTRSMKTATGLTPTEASARGGLEAVLDALLRGARPDGPSEGPSPVRRMAAVAGLALLAGCASISGGVDRGAIETVLTRPEVAGMHVGVLAVDAASGRVVYESSSGKKFIPASNQKVLVTAAALTMLGADHRFSTEVWALGERSGHAVEGDLVVVAAGDPTWSERYYESGRAALDSLARAVRDAGVRRVSGALVVDVSGWDSTTIGPTREVEDLRFTYGASGGAFGIDEGEITVVVEAGPAVGSPAVVTSASVGATDFVSIDVSTAAPGTRRRITPHYLPESRRLVLEGHLPYGETDTLTYAARDPVRLAAAELALAMKQAGVHTGDGVRLRWTPEDALGNGCDAQRVEECAGAERIAVLHSPPLSEIVAGVLGPSQNWMTEQLVRAMGAAYGEEGSWSEGIDLMEAFLIEHVGVDPIDVSARDGSGLSAYNLVTPRALVRVFQYMATTPFADEFRRALAQPQMDGSTLSSRLEGMEGRVYAKTGTISNVNSLSGYLVRDDGDEVIFSVLTNGSGLPASTVRRHIDEIVRALAR